ncbi:hypothetical protein ACWKWP_12370 [Agromyces soli]
MAELTEPQVWTMIGAFIALMFGMLTIVSTLFVHVVRAEVRRLDTRFDALDSRIDGLDRDVQALVKHTFGLDRG